MIKLSSILLEITSKPVAIFLGGSAGAGKTQFRKQFIDPTGEFTVLNIDDEFEPLLKKAGLPLDFRKYKGPEDLSAAGVAMGKAQATNKKKYEKSKGQLDNLVIDGTGASSREVLKKKKELEDLGYVTAMVLIFVPPDVSLYRNIKRGDEGGRTLMPAIILKSWSSMFGNIELYKKEFGDSFMIYKAFKDEDIIYKDFDPEHPEHKKVFFDPFKVKGREKTPEERKKSNEKIKELNNLIRLQLKKVKDLKFTDPSQIQKKINKLANA